jgi:hypothetical protein
MFHELLYGRVANFRVEPTQLLRYYDEVVALAPSTRYFDNEAAYDGWSITSRDGSTADGVKRIDPKPKPGVSNRRGTVPTSLCQGYMLEVLARIATAGLSAYRVRVMRLASEGFSMKTHRDSDVESWRLHIPIITNPDSFFEWTPDGAPPRRVHLPADGSAWLARVDVPHRAVNLSESSTVRVHLLTSLAGIPDRMLFDSPVSISG